MTQSKSTKRALIASAASVLISCAMLVGTTFAWFTDSVSSGKNVIQAGNLDITAAYQNTAETGTTYTIEGFDRNNGEVTFGETATDINKDNAIITEKLWEPGAVGAKLITVKNNGNLAAKVKLRFEVEDKGLQEGLWFDFIQVKSDGTVSGQFTKREMSMLSELANKVELPLLPKGTEGKDRVSFILLYGMKEEAGNQYMNTSFEADVTILATQYTYESDSFDNQYDDIGFDDVFNLGAGSSSEDLTNALESVPDQGTVVYDEAITVEKNVTINSTNKTVSIDLGKKTFRTTNSEGFGFVLRNGSARISNGSMSTVNTNGAFGVLAVAGGDQLDLENLVIENFKGNGMAVDGRSTSTKIKLENVTIRSQNGGGFTTYGTADLYNCTMTQSGYYNWNSNNVSVSNGGTVNVHSGSYTGETFCLYVYNSGGTINVYDGTFQAETVLKADYNTGASTINVYGGSFTGKLSIASRASLNIEAGTFAGTGLTLEQFKAFVAPESTVSEKDGVFTVTK